MSLVYLQKQRDALVGEAKSLLASDAELSEPQEQRCDQIREQVGKLDSRIESLKKVDSLLLTEQRTVDLTNKPETKDFKSLRERFSIHKVLRRMLGDNVDTGLEDEVSAEIKQTTPHRYEGVPVPMEAIERRATAGPVTVGGAFGTPNIIGPDYRPSEFVPYLRDNLVSSRLGVRILRGLMGNVTIPKAKDSILSSKADRDSTWKSETGALIEDTPEYEDFTMSPKKTGVLSQWSRQAVLQTTPGIEMLIRDDIGQQLARVIDEAFLFGTGASNQPSGVTTRFTETTHSGTITDGATLTRDSILELPKLLDLAKIMDGSRSFLTSPALCYKLMGVRILSGSTDSMTIVPQGGMSILGMPTITSTMIPANLTKGSGTNLSYLFYGNWNDFIIGFWQDIDLLVNPYESTAYKAGNVYIRAMLFLDTAIRYDKSIAYYKDVITT